MSIKCSKVLVFRWAGGNGGVHFARLTVARKVAGEADHKCCGGSQGSRPTIAPWANMATDPREDPFEVDEGVDKITPKSAQGPGSTSQQVVASRAESLSRASRAVAQ